MLLVPPRFTLFPYTTLFRSVKFGATVNLVDEDSGDKSKYKIVGEDESDVKGGKISITSPIARDRKSTRLNSSHMSISYAVFCLKKKMPFKALTLQFVTKPSV